MTAFLSEVKSIILKLELVTGVSSVHYTKVSLLILVLGSFSVTNFSVVMKSQLRIPTKYFSSFIKCVGVSIRLNNMIPAIGGYSGFVKCHGM